MPRIVADPDSNKIIPPGIAAQVVVPSPFSLCSSSTQAWASATGTSGLSLQLGAPRTAIEVVMREMIVALMDSIVV